MIHDRRLSAALLLCAAAAAMAETPPPDPQPVGSIRGRVLDSGGEPLASAVVRLIQAGYSMEQRHDPPGPWSDPVLVSTDEQGIFDSGPLGGPSFDVRVEHESHAPFDLPAIAANAQPLSITLQAGVSVGGRILSAESRKTVAGARILACDPGSRPFGQDACRKVATDEQGRFRAENLPPGPIVILAVAPGLAFGKSRMAATAGEPRERVELYLHPGGRLSGRVLSRAGRKLERVRLSLEPEDLSAAQLRDVTLLAAFSGEDGSFSMDGILAGHTYRVRGSRAGWPDRSSEAVHVPAGGQRENVIVTLAREARVRIRLVDDRGDPVQASPQVTRLTPGGSRGRRLPADQIETDGSGQVELLGLQDGLCDLRIDVEGWEPLRIEDVELRAADTTDLGERTLDAGLTLSGRVLDPDGRVIDGASLVALGPERKIEGLSASDGRFRLAGLASQVVTLEAGAEGFARTRMLDLSLPAEDLEITLEPAGKIRGRVEMPDRQQVPAFQAAAYAETTDGAAGSFYADASKNFVDPEGLFLLDGLTPGRYTVQIDASGWAPSRTSDLQVEAGQILDAGVVRLERGLGLEGKIVAADDGAPVIGASVRASGQTPYFMPNAGASESAISDSQGEFRLRGLTPAQRTLQVTHTQFAGARVELSPPQDGEYPPLIVRLSLGGSVSGSIRDRSGAPLSGASIFVYQDTSEGLEPARTTSRPDGRYEVVRLHAGSYMVNMIPPGGDVTTMAQKPVAVRDGETSVVDFDGRSTITLRGTVLRGGQPQPELELLFLPSTGGANPAGAKITRSDALGHYEIGLDQPGAYGVAFRSANRAGALTGTPIEVLVPDQSEVHLDLTIQSGSIDGVVVDADGRPRGSAVVRAERSGSIEDDITAKSFSTTDASGAYEMTGLSPGSYRVSASAAGFKVAVVPQVAVAEGPTSGVDFRLERGRIVEGRIVDPSGAGIARAFVFASPSGGFEEGSTGVSDVNGRFELTAADSSALDIVAIAAGWAPTRIVGWNPPEGSPEALILQAGTGGSLAIQVLDSSGVPMSAARVLIQPVPRYPGSDVVAMYHPIPPTDGEGRARIALLAPGTYEIGLAGRTDVPALRVRVDQGTETSWTFRTP